MWKCSSRAKTDRRRPSPEGSRRRGRAGPAAYVTIRQEATLLACNSATFPHALPLPTVARTPRQPLYAGWDLHDRPQRAASGGASNPDHSHWAQRMCGRSRIAGTCEPSISLSLYTRHWRPPLARLAAKRATVLGDCDRRRFEMKLLEFQRYYNGHRAHARLTGSPPASIPDCGPREAPFVSLASAVAGYHTPMSA
jgi:hypothetical protein